MKADKNIVLVVISVVLLTSPKGWSDNLTINGDFSQGNTNFLTQYSFYPSNSYWPGTYTVGCSTTNFNPQLDYFPDHTTGTGMMMIVDGGWNQEVVWQQALPVSPNTTYRFSGWYVGTHVAMAACIQYKVNGVPIGSPFTIPEGSGMWGEYAVLWGSGSATSAVLQIVDLQTDNYVRGNDFAVDDIAFADEGTATPSAMGIGMYAGVELRGSIGATYRVEYRHDMGHDENWIHVATVVLSSSPYVIYHRESNGKRALVYRVIQQ
jgi:hypothetical protein